MAYLRSAVAAFALFVPLLIGLWLFWIAVLVGLLGSAWSRLGAAAAPVGTALMVFAVLSGLVLYVALLRLVLAGLGIPRQARSRHLLTTGLLPIAATAAFLWLAVANLRLGL
jgi:hypothetical protein